MASPESEFEFLTTALGADGARRLRPHMTALELAAGDLLVRDGQLWPMLCVVISGEVVATHEVDGREIELGARGAGEWLGEVGFIDGGPATATLRARTACKLLTISHARLVDLVQTDPQATTPLVRHVSAVLAGRIAESSAGILEQLAGGHARVRAPDEVRSWASRALGALLGLGRTA